MADLGRISVLVTGGTGFIGSHLVHRLLTEGCRVCVLVRPSRSPGRIADVLSDLSIWPGDVTDALNVQECVATISPEIVFHLAGATEGRIIDPGLTGLDRSFDTNLHGSLNVIRAAQSAGSRLRKFIRLGGLAEYGNGPTPFREEQREAPASTYAASQVAVTHLGQMLARTLNFPIVTLRPALTYGPAQSEDFFIPSCIRHCLRGVPFEMTSGEQSRDLVYIDDVVDALLKAAKSSSVSGEVINIGSGRDCRIREVAETIVRMSGANIPLRIGAKADHPADIRCLFCSPAKAERILNWRALTPLDAGLQKTISWFRSERPSDRATWGEIA